MYQKAMLTLTSTWAPPGAHHEKVRDKVVIMLLKRRFDDEGPNTLILRAERSSVTDAGEQLLMIDNHYEIIIRPETTPNSISNQAAKNLVWNYNKGLAVFARYADWAGMEQFVRRILHSEAADE